MKKNLLLALVLTALCGCLDVQDELTINGDGSGSVHIEVKSAAGMSDYLDRGGGMDPDSVLYPPTVEREARLFFPGPDFDVKSETRLGDSGDQTLVIDATFKDVNALLASPYARTHAIELRKDGDTLAFRALPGIGGMAHLVEGARGNKQAAMYFQMASQMGGARELKAKFKVNLPNAITQANGQRDDKSVMWLADRNQTTNAAVFLKQASRVLEAGCGARGVTFMPNGPIRPALMQFSGLPSGALGSAAAGPDEKAVQAAAKFVPCALQVQRTVDLSGTGYGGGNQATLVGFVVMPSSFKPQRWGKPELDEVLDANGRSLRLAEDEEAMGYARRYSSMFQDNFGEDANTEEGAESPAAPPKERHLVEFQFQSPDWSVKSISKLSGSISWTYGGGLHVAKITNAIPPSWIPETKDSDDPFGTSYSYSSDEEGARRLRNPELDRLKARLTCESVSRQAGGLRLQLNTESKTCVLKEIQVYDADGNPCPTMVLPSPMTMGEELGTQVFVGGEPKPPLSMGIIISGGGASVKLPIELEDIPVRNP